MRANRTLTTLALLAAVTTGLTGCGSDDKSSDSGKPNTGTVAPTDDKTDETDSSTSDICAAVTDDEIEAIVGAPITREEIPGGGCTFNQEDLRAAGISLNTTPYDESTGGFDAAISGVSATLDGTGGGPVDGIGEEAYVKTGTAMGGSSQQGGGLVHVGNILVQVTVIQGAGLSAEKVEAMVVDTLKLVAEKA
ncbi:DUF3558 domain-containing protein [Nocardioides marmoriginsengisoli]|uniref:DUF3558 domain-containing protein n=1 Tax=Nocardioides marmoriginsengisoli TaxID=661483 RepID=A0A3N0CNJ8_9ACTN|nr:DUF3558 family protein [Nocardioides marmoriginsengisoli]RNL65054.1 DUF3558 domain-containing protein [Nocardioides marmoriginsengisoli]